MAHPAAAFSVDHDSPWLTSQQAAAALGVQRASLYSYVSRGLLQAHARPGQRGRVYARADVQRLARQRQSIRNPARLAQSTLDWGTPVLSSAITQVQNGQLYYRGQSATALARHVSLEAVTALLLAQAPVATGMRRKQSNTRQVSPVRQPRSPAQALAAWHQLPSDEAAEFALSDALALLQAMARVLVGLPRATAASHKLSPLHEQLAGWWQLDANASSLLRQALVLCADHELNASSFAARVVASTGASLHASIGAGLAALSGPLHGGMTAVIASHWDEWHQPQRKRNALPAGLAALLRQTSAGPSPAYCAGFGHPLYPAGDPRSLHLLPLLPADPVRERLLQAVHVQTGQHPSLDYALVAIERSLQLPPGAAFVLFALGRTAGWMAHALEQRASGQLIRPRAHYQGLQPDSDAPTIAPPSGRIIRF
ncbi:citrate synthase family protein [Comamonas sp. J-3]|uniref:citrate synthase family protein n=1 Tax=Comamonas trifloxystrobinivorans TaxID=3350256 RepID=UPI0037290377